MSYRVTCHIKGKTIVFYREVDGKDAAFHTVRIDECHTLPAISQELKELKKETWMTPALLNQFESMVKGYHGLDLKP